MRSRPSGKILRQVLDNAVRSCASLAGRVAETTLALAVIEIENHVVIVFRAGSHGDGIEI
jgi:hypothetical protein